jgi:hypothetical protein
LGFRPAAPNLSQTHSYFVMGDAVCNEIVWKLGIRLLSNIERQLVNQNDHKITSQLTRREDGDRGKDSGRGTGNVEWSPTTTTPVNAFKI